MGTRCIAISLALVLAVGCGDSTDTTAGTGGGGAGGSGGSGGAAAGTQGDSGNPRDGRGPTPPAAQGAVSLHLAELDDTMVRCSPGRQWVNAPSTPVLIQTQQTSGVTIGTRAVDGSEGSHVACAVQKSGDKFTFSADITTPRTDGTQPLHPTVLHFDASAVSSSGPAAKGTVTAMTDTTLANYADDQCSFSVTSLPSLGVDAGKIWTSVTCERLAHPSEPDDACRIDVGFVVFENCVQ